MFLLKLRALVLTILLVASWPAAGGSATPDAPADLEARISPTFFDATEPIAFVLTLSFHSGGEGGLGVIDAVIVRPTAGTLLAAVSPTPPTGWFLTRYVRDPAAPLLEFTAALPLIVGGSTEFAVNVDAVDCGLGFAEQPWSVTAYERRAGLSKNALVTNPAGACDRLPPVLLSATGDLSIGTDDDSITLRFDVTDDTMMTGVVTAVDPDGLETQINVSNGEALFAVPDVEHQLWTYSARFTDAAGNQLRIPDGTDVFQITITDTSAPTVDLVAPRQVEAGRAFNVSFTSDDNVGIAERTLRWRLDDGPWQEIDATGRSTFSFAAVHDWTSVISVEFAAADARGNTAAATRAVHFVDTIAPMLSSDVSPQPPRSQWYAEAPTVMLNATDVGSPRLLVNYVFLDAEGRPLGDAVSGAPPIRVPLGETGRHTVRWNATDDAGNVAGDRILVVALDVEVPHATFTGVPAGWAKDDVALSFVPSAQASGFDVREWTVDGRAQPEDHITITGEGEHPITWRLRSGAGSEASGQQTVWVDKTLPSIDIDLSGEGDSSSRLFLGDVEIAITVADALSTPEATVFLDGVAHPVDAPLVVTEAGEHALHVRANDEAGNEATRSLSFIIDRTPPTLAIKAVADGDPLRRMFRSNVEFTLTAADSSSGASDITFSRDGDTFQPYGGPFLISEEGPHALTARTTDRAGNAAETVFDFIIDRTHPDIFVTITGTGDDRTSTYRSDVTVHIEASDAVELSVVEYSLDGGAYSAVTSDLIISDEGAHHVDVRARDVAGNVLTDSADVFIDRTPPQLWIIVDDKLEGDGFGAEAMLTLGWAGVREGEDIRASCRLDGETIDPTGGVWVEREGDHTATCSAEDGAGNVANDVVRTFFVDLSPPSFDMFVDAGPTRTVPFMLHPEDRGTLHAVDARIASADGSVTPVDITLSDGVWRPTSPIALADGEHELQARAIDEFAHDSGWTPLIGFSLVTNVTPTFVTITPEAPATAEDVTIAWTFEDHIVDAWMLVSVDGDTPMRMTSPIVITEEGDHTVALQPQDELGNTGEGPAFAFTIDRTAPDVVDPVKVDVFTAAASWEHSFRATSGGSPAIVMVTANGEEAPSDIVLDSPGRVALTYQAVDTAGNRGPIYAMNVTIDREAPSIILPNATAATASGSISWDIQDALSPLIDIEGQLRNSFGARKLNVSSTGGIFYGVEGGVYTIELHAVDAAGNVAEAHAELIVDLTGPVIRLSQLPAWTSRSRTITLDGDRSPQAVDEAKVELKFEHGMPRSLEVTEFPFTFEVPTDAGDVEVTALARDRAGRVSILGPHVIVVDVTPPTINVNGAGASDGPIAVTATATDDKDKFPSLRYQTCRTTCSSMSRWPTGGVLLEDPGSYRLVFTATDFAGFSTTREERFVVTAPPPENQTGAPVDEIAPPPQTDPGTAEPPVTPTPGSTIDPPPPHTPADPPAPTPPVNTPNVPTAAPRSYAVTIAGRNPNGTVSDEGLTFTAARLVGLDFGRGIVRADGNVVTIPAALLPAGRSMINIEYVWADGPVTRETIEIVRPASIERTSQEPPTVGAATDVPMGWTVPLAALLLAALAVSRRRRHQGR